MLLILTWMIYFMQIKLLNYDLSWIYNKNNIFMAVKIFVVSYTHVWKIVDGLE